MLANQFRNSLSPSKANKPAPPFVFYYTLSDNLEICLDGKTYGNDARFCRRSHDFNAELRHVIDKGSLHLFIVAKKTVEKNQEILLPPETRGIVKDKSHGSPLPSINADLREISRKKPNGVVNSSSSDENQKKSSTQPLSSKKKSKKSKPDSSKSNKKPSSSKKLSLDDDEEDEERSDNEMNGDAANVTENNSNNTAPSSPSKAKPSPGKLGLPDSSGLIVGVNTINYDASSSLRNKAKVQNALIVFCVHR